MATYLRLVVHKLDACLCERNGQAQFITNVLRGRAVCIRRLHSAHRHGRIHGGGDAVGRWHAVGVRGRISNGQAQGRKLRAQKVSDQACNLVAIQQLPLTVGSKVVVHQAVGVAVHGGATLANVS